MRTVRNSLTLLLLLMAAAHWELRRRLLDDLVEDVVAASSVEMLRVVHFTPSTAESQLHGYQLRSELTFVGRFLSASQMAQLPPVPRSYVENARALVPLRMAVVAWVQLPRFEAEARRLRRQLHDSPAASVTFPILGASSPASIEFQHEVTNCLSMVMQGEVRGVQWCPGLMWAP